MDLKKLGRLSCLNISDADSSYFQDSLTDVMNMMDSIEGVEYHETKDTTQKSPIVENFENNPIMLNKGNTYQGILLEQGVFLAPKVIKKD